MGGIQPNFFIKNVTFEYDYDYNKKLLLIPPFGGGVQKGLLTLKL